jgi:hypothetical protein
MTGELHMTGKGDEVSYTPIYPYPHEPELGGTINVKLSPADPTEDNWIHRSAKMRCRICMYFVEKEEPSFGKPVGRCRRHAPTLQGWPVMFEDDWCGDHKIDETKI